MFSIIVWRESTEFHVILMNSKRQVKGNLVTWYKYTLEFAVAGDWVSIRLPKQSHSIIQTTLTQSQAWRVIGYCWSKMTDQFIQMLDQNCCETIFFIFQIKFELYKKEHSTPGEVICQLAADTKAQLIVTGSRGMGTIRRTFLGSVSDYCVHHSLVPVAVVPPPIEGCGQWGLHKVLKTHIAGLQIMSSKSNQRINDLPEFLLWWCASKN